MFGRESNYISLKLSKICKIPKTLSHQSTSPSLFPCPHAHMSQDLKLCLLSLLLSWPTSINQSEAHRGLLTTSPSETLFSHPIPKWIIPILVMANHFKFLGPRKNALLFENNKRVFQKQLLQECPGCKFRCCFPHLRLQPISASMHSWTERFRDFLQILESFWKM